MCSVSMVIDQWRDMAQPNYIPPSQWAHDPVLAQQMLDVIKRLEEIDKKLGALDCKVSQPVKKGFKKKLRRAARGTA